jgi:hypothetical protein
MELILDLTSSAQGRMSGTVSKGSSSALLPFSGALELVARLEQLLDEPDDVHPSNEQRSEL